VNGQFYLDVSAGFSKAVPGHPNYTIANGDEGLFFHKYHTTLFLRPHVIIHST
jgi:hypothetical protein